MPHTYVQLPDGSYVQVPPDATPAQLAQFKVKLAGMQGQGTPIQSTGTIGPASQVTGPGATGSAQLVRKISNYMQQAQNLTPQGAAQHPIQNILGKMAGFAFGGSQGIGTEGGGILTNPVTSSLIPGAEGEPALAGAVRGIAGLIKGSIPSAVNAGQKFQQVMAATKDVPIDVGPVQDAAFRAEQMAKAGGKLPKVISDFIKETTNARNPAMDYERARDFYTNATSKLAPEEAQSLTPVMFRQLGEFTRTLRQSLTDATSQSGQAQTFGEAMQEYHRAGQVRDAIEFTKEAMLNKLKQAGAGGAAAAGAYGTYKALGGGKK